MNFRHLFSKQSINRLSRLKHRKTSPQFIGSSSNASTIPTQKSPSPSIYGNSSISDPAGSSFSRRELHSYPELKSTALSINIDSFHNDTEETDDTMNEFLSRFVYLMRGKLNAAYPECNKQTIDGMLLVIVEKVVAELEKGTLGEMLGESMSNAASPSGDFSDDLWRTVWEVSSTVCKDMDKERKKEQMKKFLQSEEVKKMARFASEVGVRGDMLRELKFKWAREKMEESEFYESLKELKRQEEEDDDDSVEQIEGGEEAESGESMAVEKMKVVSLPKRKGKNKYSIYGLDLSDPKWKDVADKLHEADEVLWPKEAKPITGKCKLVTEKILSMEKEEDPFPLLAEWVELLQPSRADWDSLLQRLQERNAGFYYKVVEHVLDEPTFETNIRDFSKLIDAYAKENRLEDVERILAKMSEKGIQPDILILTILVHTYSKVNNVERAKQAYETLKIHGFKPNKQLYTSMIMAYVNVGQPYLGELLTREMETRNINPSEEVYLALLRAFAQQGEVNSAQRISNSMQLGGFQPSLESCTLLVEACARAGEMIRARINFDYMLKSGFKPDDKSVAAMLDAYKFKNALDKALDLLLQLEKQGFVPGVATYTALLDWLAEMQLIDEAEQVLDKIARLGETPPLKIHISLCDMYSKAKFERKALQSLKVVEAKKDQLEQADFERLIKGLSTGNGEGEQSTLLRGLNNLPNYISPRPAHGGASHQIAAGGPRGLCGLYTLNDVEEEIRWE
ncbi:hypothetical protein V2J09_023787 [Rumex salicifolius]